MTNQHKAERTEYAIVTQWFKHGDHAAVVDYYATFHNISQRNNKNPSSCGFIPIEGQLDPEGEGFVRPSDIILEYLHNCEPCGGKGFTEHMLEWMSRIECNECEGKGIIKSGRIEVLSEQEYNDSTWSKCDE